MRGIYFLKGRDYVQSNYLEHDRPLPDVYWGDDSKMLCMTKAVEQTRETAYAHHIQRLMVTGITHYWRALIRIRCMNGIWGFTPMHLNGLRRQTPSG